MGNLSLSNEALDKKVCKAIFQTVPGKLAAVAPVLSFLAKNFLL